MKIEIGKKYLLANVGVGLYGNCADILNIANTVVTVERAYEEGDFRIVDEKGFSHVCEAINLENLPVGVSNTTYKTTFQDIKRICMYYIKGYEDGAAIDTCRDRNNIPKGHSWGMCNEAVCPFMKGLDVMEKHYR